MAERHEQERSFGGFADLQVNGFAGVDFNDPNLTPDNFIRATRALLETGVTTYCPTVITNSKENLVRIFSTLRQAVENDPIAGRMIPCFHLEGPYISEKDGYKGAHDDKYIRNPSREEFEELQKAAGGRIGLVTLAPEREGAIEFIKYLRGKDIKVAIGHTAASQDQIDEAVKAGVSLSTHLGNGIARQLDRTANPIMDQLASDSLSASFIADGHHIPESALKVFFRAKGIDKSILVTDAMSAAGAPSGIYTLGGLTMEVGGERIVHLPGQPYLAGSALTMPEAVENAVRLGGVSFDKALRMAFGNPLRYLGVEQPEGFRVFYTWSEGDKKLSVRRTEVNFSAGPDRIKETFYAHEPRDARRD